VIGADLFAHEDYHIGDYNTPEKAFKVADSPLFFEKKMYNLK
jgi:hypothetical protein